eukprot:16432364-Heterocapsa_arctica.AAC.1
MLAEAARLGGEAKGAAGGARGGADGRDARRWRSLRESERATWSRRRRLRTRKWKLEVQNVSRHEKEIHEGRGGEILGKK